MQVKTSKCLARELNKFLVNMEVTPVTLTGRQFEVLHGDVWNSDSNLDFDDDGNNVYKIWRISYPSSFYACNVYVTDNDLTRIFKRSDHSIEDLAREFMEEYSI